MDFMNSLKNEASKTLTENGAVGYSTTGKALVDFNFKIPSYRKDKSLLAKDLLAIIDEKDPYLFKYLFYLRDCREGLGERDAFRSTILTALEKSALADEEKQQVIFMIPAFGRWDDILIFADTEYEDFVFNMIKEQLALDEAAMVSGTNAFLMRNIEKFLRLPIFTDAILYIISAKR